MPEFDNLIEYADPVIYDLENDSFEPDGPFYLARARRVNGPVLELGCGTGRITIPLAESGIDITGLDVVPDMLARAQAKAAGLSIHWVEADARSFQLNRRYDLIIEPGGTFQHLVDRADHEALLDRVRAHLAPGGRFVVSAIFPRPQLMVDVTEEENWFAYANEQGQEVRVSGTQSYDALKQVRIETAFRRWHDTEGREVLRKAPLALRLWFPQELEALLHYNGFEMVERCGDWSGGALTQDSSTLIFVCEVAKTPFAI